MIKEFKPGDVVRLKSGGPKMAVSMIYAMNDTPVGCVWFDTDGKLQSGRFPYPILMDAKDSLL